MNDIQVLLKKQRTKTNDNMVFEVFLAMAKEACTNSVLNGVPKYTDEWLQDNIEMILAAFSYGYSAKVVCSIFGIPWDVWNNWVNLHENFMKLNSFGESMQLMQFEQVRNELARGERRGSTTAALHVIDRLHSDVYFGKPGMTTHNALEHEMSFEQALAILDEAGIDVDEVEEGEVVEAEDIEIDNNVIVVTDDEMFEES